MKQKCIRKFWWNQNFNLKYDWNKILEYIKIISNKKILKPKFKMIESKFLNKLNLVIIKYWNKNFKIVKIKFKIFVNKLI